MRGYPLAASGAACRCSPTARASAQGRRSPSSSGAPQARRRAERARVRHGDPADRDRRRAAPRLAVLPPVAAAALPRRERARVADPARRDRGRCHGVPARRGRRHGTDRRCRRAACRSRPPTPRRVSTSTSSIRSGSTRSPRRSRRSTRAPRCCARRDEADASHQGLVDDEVARLDFAKSAAELDRWIRGCDPQPGAWAQRGGEVVRCYDGAPRARRRRCAPRARSCASTAAPHSSRRAAGSCASAARASATARSSPPRRCCAWEIGSPERERRRTQRFEAALDAAGLNLRAALADRDLRRRGARGLAQRRAAAGRAHRDRGRRAAAARSGTPSRARPSSARPRIRSTPTRAASPRPPRRAARAAAARALFAFERRGGVYADFVELGRLAGLGAPSRLRLLLHPLYGPWMSLRAIVLTRAQWEIGAAGPLGFDPCRDCPAPCEAAGPDPTARRAPAWSAPSTPTPRRARPTTRAMPASRGSS